MSESTTDANDETSPPPRRRRRRKRFIRFMSGGDESTQPEQIPTPPVVEQKTETESEAETPVETTVEQPVVEQPVEVIVEHEESTKEITETENAAEVITEQENSVEERAKKKVEKQDSHVNLRIRGPPVMDHTWSRATELTGPPRDPLGLGWIVESPEAAHRIEKPRGAPINPLRPHERRGAPDPLVEGLCEDDTLTRAVDAVQGLLQGLNAPTSEEE